MSAKEERKGTLRLFVTIGARTARGGRITSGSKFKIGGLPVACVGDVVTYSDGSEALIRDGAGLVTVVDVPMDEHGVELIRP